MSQKVESLTFKLSAEQLVKLRVWTAEQDQLMLEQQTRELAETPDEFDVFRHTFAAAGVPYYGTIRGELTYSFAPNSVGEMVWVTHSGTKAELDLTDYASF